MPWPEAWPTFIAALAFFHISEFLLVALLNRRDLSRRSWLVSKPYCVAMAAGCAEFWVERRLCPWIKLAAVSRVGLAAMVAGELLRKAAMITARHNFTHMLQYAKRPDHELVTGGVYGWLRHPGYAGWMLWALGTQALLCNPICAAAFVPITWRFFRDRIATEDYYLQQFFGMRFLRYRSAVPSGIPWVT